MKKWKLKKIKEAAATIQQQAITVREKISGADFLKRFPDFPEEFRKTIDPAKNYLEPVTKPISNYRKLKKFFKEPANKKELDSYKK